MSKIVELTYDPKKGSVTVETSGFVDKSCSDVSKKLQSAFGNNSTIEWKGESENREEHVLRFGRV